jgi:hypothetical protein
MRLPHRAQDVVQMVSDGAPDHPEALVSLAIAHMQQQYPKALRREWSFAMGFDSTNAPVSSVILGYGVECPIRLNDQMVQAFHEAKALGASSLITIRYHPHPWTGFKLGSQRRFRAMRLAAKQAGVPLREQILTDITGMVFPIIGGQLASSGMVRGGIS